MRYSFVLLTLLLLNVGTAQSPSAIDILDRAISYHDPNNSWPSFHGKLFLTEYRETENRSTQFTINNSIGKFLFERGDVSHGMLLDSCFIISGDVDCERVNTIRNYYLYLWGLPMKLKDNGTPLQKEVKIIEDWQGRQVYALDVNYERENWSFFFDQNTYALIAYQFYFNYKEGGELILLEDEVEYAGMKFPKSRTWYSLPKEEYLAKDILDAIK